MNYLSVEELSKSYADKLLFEEISFGLFKGDKTALIADNGTGKSTLLKIIAGKDFADEGKVVTRSGIRIGYLAQTPVFGSHSSIDDFIKNTPLQVSEIIRKYHHALEQQAKQDTSAIRRTVQLLSNQMDKHQGWDFERRMKEMLFRFGITDLSQKTDTLSGGQKKRLALGLLLLDNPDLLLLDEPTNHLDIDMIEWLENYLTDNSKTFLIVTHDRYFLDKVCKTIIELDNGKLYSYSGNYSYFLVKRAERIEKKTVEIEKANKLMKKELEWIRRMPKARTHKSKARIDAFNDIKVKASERVGEEELRLDVSMQRLGGKIVEARHISKSYGAIKILEDFDYLFKKGDRIGIIGKNGVGKSSFLNLIMGLEQPDKGKIISGDTLVTGYYKQEGLQASPEKRVIDVVKDIAEIMVLDKNRQMTASQFLTYFLFPPKMQIQPVSKLSGGELRRLYLLTILVKNPNFLILDEPTNDLDIATLNKMDEFLSTYKGCLILVSHDRFFLDRLTDHLFVFEGDGKIKDFYGNYNEYKVWTEAQDNLKKIQKVAEKQKRDPSREKVAKKKKGLTFNEKREYEQVEKEIEQLEEEKSQLESIINQGLTDYKKLKEVTSKIGNLIIELDEKMMRWMELDEKKGE